MLFKLDRFFLDERDLFTFFFGLFLLAAGFFKIPLAPFRFPSLVVLFVFLLVTRTMVSSLKFRSYFFIALSGLLFCLFLSPYGLMVYLFVAIIIYTKTNLI